jgi:hypothetical protein
MAYEPSGGTSEPYDKSEDLNYSPGGSVQDYIRNMMQQGNVGIAQPMGAGIPDFAQDEMYGRTPPADLQMTPGAGSGMNPQDAIDRMMMGEQGDPYQVAGDVVPMRGIVRPQDTEEFNTRMGRVNANPYMGSRGMQSIDRLGGGSPHLDLMDVLMGRFNQGK